MLSHELHNQLQRDYYRGALKSRVRPAATPYVLRHVDEAIRFAGIREGERVLDVGCGAGRHAFVLAARGIEVEGLELSNDLLQHLREFDGGRFNLHVHCGDVVDPPAGLEGRYDVVAGFFILHHLDDLAGTFRGIHWMLRRGGRAIFVEPNAWNPLFYAQIALTPRMRWAAEKGMLNMRRPVLAQAIQAGGLREPEFRTFGFLPPFLRNNAFGGAVEAAFERIPGIQPVRPFLLARARKP